MFTNEKKLKKYRREQIAVIITSILLIFSILFIFIFVIIPIISSIKVAYLAKDPKNISNNGCLLYANKATKYGEPMLYLNQQGPYTLRQLSINPDDFDKKFTKLIKDSGISYDEFRKIHRKKCIKVRYIHSKVLWVSSDDIYDLQ